jgi:hypothetical protein
MKTRIALAVAGLTLMAAPTTALAKPPTKTPPPPDPYMFTIAAEDTPCGAFTVMAYDGETYTTHVDRYGEVSVVRVSGKLDFTITSDETHKSLDLHIPGPGAFYPDGSAVLYGPMLLFDSEIFAYVNGRAAIPVSGVNDVQISGRRTDLCPILNP